MAYYGARRARRAVESEPNGPNSDEGFHFGFYTPELFVERHAGGVTLRRRRCDTLSVLNVGGVETLDRSAHARERCHDRSSAHEFARRESIGGAESLVQFGGGLAQR